MGALMTMFHAVFPPVYTKEKHKKAMRKYMPRIVALHSSGNVALQSGHYITANRLAQRHRQARKILGSA